ncbi:transcription initiation factor TFB [Haloterrigena sp. H1]|nr:transcription initiation factor TFB [Haloterrigena sp. H1]TMT81778.1 transcription initiation factor TFB [Haloterrigena sp. H1]
MTFREVYETTFYEDVQPDSSASPCPNCNGRVTTNAVETRCEGCGHLIEPQHYQTQKRVNPT